MNEVIEKEEIKIENMIYKIRGKQVMLDSDLAKLYQCKNGTKTINLAVKRNIKRFPKDFCFQLTEDEYNTLRFQIETANNRNMIRSLPYVFTEQGVSMLSAILKTDIAIEESIKIIRVFVEMKKYISNNLIEQKYINNQVMKNTEDIKLLQESFDKLNKTQEYDGIFFDGQVYDSYSLLIDIFNTANNNIHDRFIIIDNKELYHVGASLKDLGNKYFAINKIENKEWLNHL